MGLSSLLEVSSMPILQVLIISVLGAFMATDYLKLLPPDARKSLNKIVFAVFTPSLVFASLVKTVRLEDIISWCFMTVNIGITFVVGGTLGWLAVKILRPEPHLQDLIIAIYVCNWKLGKHSVDNNPSNLQGGWQSIWGQDCLQHSWTLICFFLNGSWILLHMDLYSPLNTKRRNQIYRAMLAAGEEPTKEPKKDLEKIEWKKHSAAVWNQILGIFYQIVDELKAPPLLAAVIGFIFGAASWLRNLIIGENAPFRVIDDSIKLLGDGTIPCITLILGGNLTQGLSNARLGSTMVLAVICVRYIILPAIGVGVVKAASHLGFLPSDPLYHFVRMIQFTLPPAISTCTITQLFDVAQEECSVLFLWTCLVAALSLTGWSTVFHVDLVLNKPLV